ncbi:Alpha/Beta hydrolase protein [Aspergillus karnatakaensis]|uniref:Alpha/Beta hydrolase protein n=1 Tax=Aspergillus karnatakaensis TaxID=1810916 RepID=UPI003CCCCA36
MLFKIQCLLLLPFLLGGGILAATHRNHSVYVDFYNGTIIGVEDISNRVQRFLGIPYAQPPVGDLRLQRAVSLNASFGKLKAQTFGPSCYGPDIDSNPNSSEDCLTLNIWRPTPHYNADNLKPVLVWFYGGSLRRGFTADPRFEGTNLVRISSEINKDIVFVSVNYRLGPLGFLNGQQMADLDLLNLGMLDQRLALHWVQENIAAFGGDPSKVTIGGQSAGSVSSYSHMTAYGGRDDKLFRAAILQSGGAFPLTLANTSVFQETFDSLVTDTFCSALADAPAAEQLDCIRRLPLEAFLSNVGSNTGQSIDGSFTQTSIHFSLPAEKYVKVATLIGTNSDEGTNSAPTGVNTTEELSIPLADGFFRPQQLPNSTVSKLLTLYPDNPRLGCPYNTGSTPLTPGKLDKKACSIFGDIVQIGPARMIARQLAKNSRIDDNTRVPIYRYRFNHLPHDVDASNINSGIGTGVEQRYVFSNLVPDHPWDRALAYEMSSAWISFVHGLNPNPNGASTLPFWPEYGDEGKSIVFSGQGSIIEDDMYRAEAVDYIIENVLPDGAL